MDRRVVKTKKSIMDAYIGLLAKKEQGKITISDIAKKAGIDRKTFYLHYGTVDAVMQECCQNKVNEIIDIFKSKDYSKQDLPIMDLFAVINQTLESNVELSRYIITSKSCDYFFDLVKKLLVEVIIRDYRDFFKVPEPELKMYAEFYISGIIAVYIRWIKENMPMPVNELAELVTNAAVNGVRELLAE